MERNERMDKVEENLQFLSDSLVEQRRAQMKSDARMEARFKRSQAQMEQIEKHLKHITQLTRIVFENLEFLGEKAEETSKRLRRKAIK